jgi:hypothetical protein
VETQRTEEKPLTLERLYLLLSLSPLDEFIQAAVERNRLDGIGDEFRQIGASTWCVAEALLNLYQGNNSLLAARDQRRSEHLWRTALALADKLFWTPVSTHGEGRGRRATFRLLIPATGLSSRHVEVDLAHTTMPPAAVSTTALQSLSALNGRKTLLFRDEVFKDMATRRFLGPYEMIFMVKTLWTRGVTRYVAFDRQDNFVLELTEQGFTDLKTARAGQLRTQKITIGHEQIRQGGGLNSIYQKLGLPSSFIHTPRARHEHRT